MARQFCENSIEVLSNSNTSELTLAKSVNDWQTLGASLTLDPGTWFISILVSPNNTSSEIYYQLGVRLGSYNQKYKTNSYKPASVSFGNGTVLNCIITLSNTYTVQGIINLPLNGLTIAAGYSEIKALKLK